MTVAAPSANGTSRTAAPRPVQPPPSALELIRSTDLSEAALPTAAPESATPVVSVQPPGFSPEQLAALSAPLDRANVRQREQGRGRVSYLEGWQVIAEANRIFGFDGWQRQTIAVRCVAQGERPIGRDQKPGWGVTYTARVRVTVTAGGLSPLVREGSGAGHGIDVDLGQAHESALKEAETDAMKRALMTFGNPFGLALYDKQQREVTGGTGGTRQGSAAAGRPASLRVVPPSPAKAQTEATSKTEPPAAPAEPDPGLAPLDPAVTEQLLATLRSLPRPVLDGFTKAFRKRFQVPADAPSIADRICQRRHHDWIEAFLVQHQ
jgi:DNA recombination protein Rad52